MAEASQQEGGFDPMIVFRGIGSFVGGIYDGLAKFIDTPEPPFGLQFTPYYIAAVFAIFFFAWIPLNPEATALSTDMFMAGLPFVLPFLLFSIMRHAGHQYGWLYDYYRRQYCVLEIRLPQEILQGPYAMELVLRGLYQTGEINTWFDRFVGVTKAWFSLEIASTEGRIRFFLWGRRSYKELIENQIYAHYPTVQIVEVEDYTLQVPYDPEVNNLWGVEQAMQKPDPFPILTYPEFGTIDADTKEEFKSDPFAAVMEFLGSIGQGEHIWMQFIIRAHEPDSPCPYAIDQIGKKVDLQQWATIEINKKLADVKRLDGTYSYAALSQGDKLQIESIQNKLNKQPFEVGIRSVYIARKENYRGAPRTAIPSAFRSFEHGSSGRGLNGLKPVFWVGPFNFPWHDFRGIRGVMLRRRYYEAYATRQFFWPPHKHRWIVLNTEELATLYHFPGRVVATPNLERMPSRRGEAPANLPV